MPDYIAALIVIASLIALYLVAPKIAGYKTK